MNQTTKDFLPYWPKCRQSIAFLLRHDNALSRKFFSRLLHSWTHCKVKTDFK